jgi:hypothetical protein
MSPVVRAVNVPVAVTMDPGVVVDDESATSGVASEGTTVSDAVTSGKGTLTFGDPGVGPGLMMAPPAVIGTTVCGDVVDFTVRFATSWTVSVSEVGVHWQAMTVPALPRMQDPQLGCGRVQVANSGPEACGGTFRKTFSTLSPGTHPVASKFALTDTVPPGAAESGVMTGLEAAADAGPATPSETRVAATATLSSRASEWRTRAPPVSR